MKTTHQAQYSSHSSTYRKVEISTYILLQLYALQKASVTNKKLPRLPLHDKRRNTSIELITLQKQNHSAVKQTAGYLFNNLLFSEV
jgi:hypothetical protein